MNKTAKVEEIPKTIGPYSVLQSLGRGGMGEVYLAKDPVCGRQVALKRIRPELRNNRIIQSRFLREAQVASALSHPSIVPILDIQTKAPDIYYTMPFVEGETLRQILRAAREQEKNDLSIPALARIFLQVCEAVAYTHAKGIIHRDLKPENIIVGKYGEVMILDWGIADFIDQIGKEEPLPAKRLSGKEELTRPGKITGTLAYMAPERLAGKSSSVQTDIYALGVILYQILTLQLPFQRKTIAAFRKQMNSEELIDPIEMAPYRDIPHQLAQVCSKCLARSPNDRYKSVIELIGGLKNYIEGRAEWILTAELTQENKEHWQFQENILLAKHIAITRNIDVTEWAGLMISQASFANNLRVDAEICLGPESQGVGFLLSVPDVDERKNLEEGYCLWIGSEKHPSCQLFRNNVLVLEAKTLYLQPKTWHQIRIEKVDDHLKFFLDGRLKLSFTSHLPLAGTHVGLLHKEGDFELKRWKIFDGSHNVMVGCLALPNAFLSHKHYDIALQEYRRIGQCFPGRMEGREALFRAGLTLLEKARDEKGKAAQEKIFHLALKEFEKLYRTPGAPLEYLGKSLVYEALGDTEEEAKCLELCLRKFAKHPLLSIVKEHITYRMHESSLTQRTTAYRIILLAIRHIPDLLENPDTRFLIESLEKNWEPLPFFEKSENRLAQIAIQLAFWLAKPPILVEMAQNLKEDKALLGNALFSLLELEATDELKQFPSPLSISSLTKPFPAQLEKHQLRSIYYLMKQALKNSELELPFQKLKKCHLAKSEQIYFDALEIWKLLLQKNLTAASQIFKTYPQEALHQETSPLYFPYGTWVYLTEKSDRHFSALETPYPPTTALPSLFLTGKINDKKGWIERAFWWEKKELYRQLDLFYRCAGKKP
ncbi:MAG TPA: protein kinase [Chlamydiales bacterium]|nr:protein kinase [Chlamydiales bacterium]